MGTMNATSDEPTTAEKQKIFEEMVIKARLSRQPAGLGMNNSSGVAPAVAGISSDSQLRAHDPRKMSALARQYIDAEWEARGIEIPPAAAIAHIQATVDPALYTSEPAPEAPEDENAAALRQVDHAHVRRAQRYADDMHAKGVTVSAFEALEHTER